MDDQKIRMKIISGLLAPYAQAASGDPMDVLAAFVDAVEEIPTMYVGEAARRINSGLVQRHNTAFAPTPAELATEARRLRDIELTRKQRADASRQIAHSTELTNKHTPESRARVKAMVDAHIKGFANSMRTEEAEADKRRKSIFERSQAGRGEALRKTLGMEGADQ